MAILYDSVSDTENEVHITNYYQKNEFTQTSNIYLEATFDKAKALILNRNKYYLVPEAEMHRFKDVDRSGWYINLIPDFIEESSAECNKAKREEVNLK